MNYKNIFYSLILLLFGFTVCAQNALDPGWLWAKCGGSTVSLTGSFDHKMERIIDIAVDSDNNYYYLAEVGGYTFTFDEMVFDTYNNYSTARDIFVFSTDSEGNYRWSKVIGGGSTEYAASLGVDEAGYVYVSGMVFSTYSSQTPIHFDTDTIREPGISEPSPKNKSAFLIKYSSMGEFQWLRMPEEDALFGRSGAFVKTVIEPSGRTHSLVWLGKGSYFNDELIVEEGKVKYVILNYNNTGDLENFIPLDMKPDSHFVAAYHNYQLAYDANLDRYYVADTYRNIYNPEHTLSINGYGIESGLNKAFYIAALNNEGEVIWYRENKMIGGWNIGDLKLDDVGHIYFTGYAMGVDTIFGYIFDPIGTGSGTFNPFLLKLDSNGNLLWGTNSQFYSPFNGQSIVIDGNNVYLGLGMLNNTWGDLEIPGPTLGAGLTPDIQIIRFDAQTGEPQEVIQNNLITPTKDAIMAMAIDTNGALVVGGYFGSTLFGGTDLQIQKNGSDSDFFIAKYQPQNTGVGTDKVRTLDSKRVYPNPTREMLYIQSETLLHSYSLYDLQGRNIKQSSLSSNKIDLSEVESGVYVIRVMDLNGGVQNFKVVKE